LGTTGQSGRAGHVFSSKGNREAIAFSSEVGTGSREENASKQESRASVFRTEALVSAPLRRN
jgi:hypothetical protein